MPGSLAGMNAFEVLSDLVVAFPETSHALLARKVATALHRRREDQATTARRSREMRRVRGRKTLREPSRRMPSCSGPFLSKAGLGWTRG
jgi:hypothetical protein